MSTYWKRYLAWGSGVGIEIGEDRLRVSLARLRPSSIIEQGSLEIENYRSRPAVEWGREYSDFLAKHGARHLLAVVLLPRQDVIVRLVSLPGVEAKDLDAAVGYQLDTLHPYADDDYVAAWSRLENSPEVLVGIARKQIFDEYSGLFAEADIKVASFTFSAAVFYSVLRLIQEAPRELIAVEPTLSGLEVYGESPAKPLFSATWDLPPERAVAMAAAELRIDGVTPSSPFPTPAFAAAATGAAPFPAVSTNLLPENLRKNTSRARYVPTAVLGTALAGLLAAIWFHEPYDTGKYVKELQVEMAKVDKRAAAIGKMDQEIDGVRGRTAMLDDFRRRTKSDLDLLLNVTGTIQPPTFLNYYESTRDAAVFGGEADQAAPLLRVLDTSPYLRNSEFQMGIMRMVNGESFRIRSQRKAPVLMANGVAVAPSLLPAPPAGQNILPMVLNPGERR